MTAGYALGLLLTDTEGDRLGLCVGCMDGALCSKVEGLIPAITKHSEQST
jgi:hypothetical protein